jgi:hypothetical protein
MGACEQVGNLEAYQHEAIADHQSDQEDDGGSEDG